MQLFAAVLLGLLKKSFVLVIFADLTKPEHLVSQEENCRNTARVTATFTCWTGKFFKALALWVDAFYKSKCLSVCLFV